MKKAFFVFLLIVTFAFVSGCKTENIPSMGTGSLINFNTPIISISKFLTDPQQASATWWTEGGVVFLSTTSLISSCDFDFRVSALPTAIVPGNFFSDRTICSVNYDMNGVGHAHIHGPDFSTSLCPPVVLTSKTFTFEGYDVSIKKGYVMAEKREGEKTFFLSRRAPIASPKTTWGAMKDGRP
ncbi:MAG: hypothetical protein PHU56_01045 [Candidatus Pacebacteria bacterium]|nr:hypothetical protein [Candidatus Paceibacterota bacterium]